VTTYGSAIYRDHVPERSASCVTALEEAGYAVVGKTNLHELAYGITSDNPHYGAVVNPLDPDLAIPWPLAVDEDDPAVLSAKDAGLPRFAEL